jgi:hypothetical protein
MQNFVANLHSLNFFSPDRFAVGHGKPRYLDRPVCAPLIPTSRASTSTAI